MKKNKYIVYGLIDPRDGKIFYIGKSCSGQEKMKRHTQPWSLRNHNPDKNRKIQEIVDSGHKLAYTILADVRSKEELFRAETVMIRHFSKIGTLLNRTNNRGEKRRGNPQET